MVVFNNDFVIQWFKSEVHTPKSTVGVQSVQLPLSCYILNVNYTRNIRMAKIDVTTYDVEWTGVITTVTVGWVNEANTQTWTYFGILLGHV